LVGCSDDDVVAAPSDVPADVVSDAAVAPDVVADVPPTSDPGEVLDVADATDVTDTADVVEGPTCAHYCAQVDLVCPESSGYGQYPSVFDCGDLCSRLPWDLGCRTEIAEGLEGGGDAVGCETAGISGGGVCGSLCENYCDFVMAGCPAVWADLEACMAGCAAFGAEGVAGATSGDSVQCRLTYAALANMEFSAGLHCPYAGADSARCTVGDAQVGDTCEAAVVIDTLPFEAEGNTAWALDDLDTDGGCGIDAWRGDVLPDVVYRYEAQVDGAHQVSLFGAATIVYVTTTCPDVAGGCVDYSGDLAVTGTWEVILAAGTTYWFVVDGLLIEDFGDYIFKLSPP